MIDGMGLDGGWRFLEIFWNVWSSRLRDTTEHAYRHILDAELYIFMYNVMLTIKSGLKRNFHR